MGNIPFILISKTTDQPTLTCYQSKLFPHFIIIQSQVLAMQYYLIPCHFQANLFQFYPYYWPCNNLNMMTDFERHSNMALDSKNVRTENVQQIDNSKRSQPQLSKSAIKEKKAHLKLRNRNQHLRELRQDEEFKERQQTGNRNICSNTLKLYFRQVRDTKSQTYRFIEEIIKNRRLDYSRSTFFEDLNEIFPKNQNYIVFEKVKFMCRSESRVGEVLRISLRRFFKYQIFYVNIKSSRTTRKIRNLQIKQGKIFLNKLFP